MIPNRKKNEVRDGNSELSAVFDDLLRTGGERGGDMLKGIEDVYAKVSKQMEIELMQIGILAPNLAEGNHVEIIRNELFEMLIFNGIQEAGLVRDKNGQSKEINISGNSITIRQHGAEVDVIGTSSVGNFYGRIKVPQRLNFDAAGILQRNEEFFPSAVIAEIEDRAKKLGKNFDGLKSNVFALKAKGSSSKLNIEVAQNGHGYIMGKFDYKNPERIDALKMKVDHSLNLEVKDFDQIVFITSKEFLEMLRDTAKVNSKLEGIKNENLRFRLELYDLLISKGGEFVQEDFVKRLNNLIEENKKNGGHPSNVVFVVMKRA